MAIITISRGTFSGGEKLAELIAAKLGYKCLSREILLEASQKYNVSLKKLVHTLDDAPGILKRMGMERQLYLSYIRAALLGSVKDEDAVYHGHAGHLLLKGIPNTIKIRITAGAEYRIKAAMEKNGLDRDQAASFIENIDKKRMEWTRFLYDEDINDPSLYDMVINLERATLESAVGLIRRAAESPEHAPTPESRKKINDAIHATEIVDSAISLDADIKSSL